MKVKDLMVREVISRDPVTNAEAAEMMWPGSCGGLQVIGMSDHDGVHTLHRKNSGQHPVETLRRKDLPTCAPGDEIRSALKTMALHQAQRLPVVDANGSRIGILSVDDVVLHAEAADLLNEDMLAAIRALWPHGRDVEPVPPPRAFA